jgi:hypothetical protein
MKLLLVYHIVRSSHSFNYLVILPLFYRTTVDVHHQQHVAISLFFHNDYFFSNILPMLCHFALSRDLHRRTNSYCFSQLYLSITGKLPIEM